jgi:hypothetical protein
MGSFEMIKIGTTVKLKVDCLGNKPGTLGVCYEIYNIGHVGYSIIFENGDYDGFSESDIELFLDVVGFDEKISNYNFQNVMKVSNDFNNGYFDESLGLL